MSTLGTLKAELAGLFGLTVADFSANGKDLLTSAINNAVRKAQANHDFEKSKVLCDLVVDAATGGVFTADSGGTNALKLHGTSTAVELARIIDMGPYDDNDIGLIAKTWMTYDEYTTRERSRTGYEYDPEFRYPANDRPGVEGVQYLVIGDRIRPIPTGEAGTTSTLGIYGCKLFAVYPEGNLSDSTEDFFLRYGHDYLMWEAALMLNHFKKEWVPRQEGNLNPPEKLRSEAWDAFIKWDTYLYLKFPEGGL